MTNGIEIDIDDFKRYNTKEQNVAIFKNLLDLKIFIMSNLDQNRREHVAIMKKQDFTNGKVKWSTKVAMAAISLTIIVLGFLFEHIITTK